MAPALSIAPAVDTVDDGDFSCLDPFTITELNASSTRPTPNPTYQRTIPDAKPELDLDAEILHDTPGLVIARVGGSYVADVESFVSLEEYEAAFRALGMAISSITPHLVAGNAWFTLKKIPMEGTND